MLTSISPIDGRYQRHTKELAEFFSEQALMKYRIIMEGEYFIGLSQLGKTALRKLSDKEKQLIRNLYNLSEADAQAIKDIETKGYKNIPATNHDVKAVEYYMKLKLQNTSLKDSLEWIHFGLTSSDTNSISASLMLSDGISKIILPKLSEIVKTLNTFAKQYKNTPMLARTHGQPASPTTVGKEFKNFSFRLQRQIDQITKMTLLVKVSGATGNYNAHVVAYPKVDWPGFIKNYVKKLNSGRKIKLEVNPLTTQIEPHDTYAEVFDIIRRINVILIGFNQDMWRYISDSWIVQKPVAGEVGSSTMPHKVNPIDFENSEGNLGLANTLFNFFSSKLPISRLQRDLSDSTVERNFGAAFGHCLIAYNSLLKGLGKITVSQENITNDLNRHPEVIAEAIQTILRREGVAMPYEQLKALTRGKQVIMEDFARFIDSLKVSENIKKELKQITPENYTGLASKLVNI